ncbi:type II secretion system F family protein [Streptomyces sp. NPDC006678]|uniref:type II secretion system F family protein n=1 Tax=Streptomyces sp. NPDC006678 TaxID=3157185 RepID=UPI00340F24D5
MSGESVHRLAVATSLLSAVVWLGCVAMARRRERRVRRRISALLGADPGKRRMRPSRRPARVPSWVRRSALPMGALITGYALAGGIAGCLLGLAGAYGLRRWQQGRARDREAGGSADGASRQLPLAAELLAACVSAGAGPREAAEAVGQSMGGPVGERLAQAAAELRLGSEPARAWGRFGEIPGAEGLARCLERAASSGAPAAEPVSRLAAGLRAERARAAASRAQRAQVLITAPVGLCFLPAFLAIGVAPVVIGLAAGLLSGN